MPLRRDLAYVFARADLEAVVDSMYGWPLHLLEGQNPPRGRGPVARTRKVLIVALVAADWPVELVDTLTGSNQRTREKVLSDAQLVTEGVSVAAMADERWRERCGVPPGGAPVAVICTGCGDVWRGRSHARCWKP